MLDRLRSETRTITVTGPDADSFSGQVLTQAALRRVRTVSLTADQESRVLVARAPRRRMARFLGALSESLVGQGFTAEVYR